MSTSSNYLKIKKIAGGASGAMLDACIHSMHGRRNWILISSRDFSILAKDTFAHPSIHTLWVSCLGLPTTMRLCHRARSEKYAPCVHLLSALVAVSSISRNVRHRPSEFSTNFFRIQIYCHCLSSSSPVRSLLWMKGIN